SAQLEFSQGMKQLGCGTVTPIHPQGSWCFAVCSTTLSRAICLFNREAAGPLAWREVAKARDVLRHDPHRPFLDDARSAVRT
ncbi:hypothetical protein Q8G50_33235, partial [Klebsiella pneumoniae]